MDYCPSTHGGAGYAPGSYWKGDRIVCGCCGEEIENPRPTGSSTLYEPWWKFGFGSKVVPTWPYWIPR